MDGGVAGDVFDDVTIVAHRAGNTVEAAAAVPDDVVVELDVHVLRGRVELRHAKVLHPTRRLWEKWYFLPKGTRGVPIGDVLDAIGPGRTLMIDSKMATRRSTRRIVATIPEERPFIASGRFWYTHRPYKARGAPTLRSCGNRWQIWLARRLPGLGPDCGVCIHERNLTADLVAVFRERTPLVYSWGAATTERCRELAGYGVTGIILDDVSLAG